MDIDLLAMLRSARGMREREKVPGVLHKGVAMCLKTGNNVGIPKDDFLFLLEDVGAEMAEEFPGFTVPIDKKGAKILLTINSKEPFGEPEDMKYWWKILTAANESWTVTSENWEGVNWGLFTGDDASMKEIVGRIVKNYKELECEYLLLPE
jgi:Fe-S oxidoreductase